MCTICLGSMRQLLKSSKVSSTERLSYFTCAHVTSLRRGFRNHAEHRFQSPPNADRSVDSICLQCFRTVATVNEDATLTTLERQHRCDPEDLACLTGRSDRPRIDLVG